MKNTHLQHPEDAILTGDLSVLDWFAAPDSHISTKMDGAPAIVWGTNPATGNKFVGTKSVFNKVKIKINETHIDIDRNHSGSVADILHHCLDYLPDVGGIIQGDFIGFGGDDTFCPNTITYTFPEVIRENIIIAPHTYYTADKDLRDAVAHPLKFRITDTMYCKIVQPEVKLHPYREDLYDMSLFAKQMSTLCEFVDEKQATKIKKSINDCIRDGYEVDENEIAQKNDCDINLIRLWKLVATMKDDLFWYITEDDLIDCKIGDEESQHEGYVISNQYGVFKVVDRPTFSRANFTIQKSWS